MSSSTDSTDASFSVEWTHRLRFSSNVCSSGSPLDQLVRELHPVKLMVVVDKGLYEANPSFIHSLENWLDTVPIPTHKPLVVLGGEAAKNDSFVVNLVLDEINAQNLCRRSCVLVIGGGAVLDAVGYAASIAHRGIPIIRMPSTTLSQSDSGVGVKNGINSFGKKNFIGVFDPPYAVVNDFTLLDTLDNRHWYSGLSEIVKVALVKDALFFDHIEKQTGQLAKRDSNSMEDLIRTSAHLHLQHITTCGDPFESLDARPLDFGHWAAHKLEQLTNFELTHGEAVSIGLAIDLKCSVHLGLLDFECAQRAITLLSSLGLPTSHVLLQDPRLLEGIEEFRQHLGGKLTLLMLEGIGNPTNVHTLDSDIVRQAIGELL